MGFEQITGPNFIVPTAPVGDSSNQIADTAFVAAAIAAASPPPGSIFGLTLSTAGSSATFGIATGVATNSTNVASMALLSVYTKTTGAWTLGTGNGSLDTGAIANSTWYHVYLIKRVDTGVVDVLTSLSATAPTLPTSYTLFRRIGSMKTNGSSQWVLFFQLGNEFLWDVPVLDVNNSTLSTTSTLFTLASIPTGLAIMARVKTLYTSSPLGAQLLVSSPNVSTQVTNTPNGNMDQYVSVVNLSYPTNLQVMTDTSARIRAVTNGGAGPAFLVVTVGWIDTRGQYG